MRKIIISVAALVLVGALGFIASEPSALGASRSKATVSLHKTGIGSVLVSPTGRTLYLFAKDRNGKSACSSSCAAYWPPLLSHGKATAGPGVKAALLGTTKRGNGSVQVTYNRHPLYTFALDKRAGQTNGEGNSFFGGKWYAVSARGTAVVKTLAVTTSTPGATTTTPYPPYP